MCAQTKRNLGDELRDFRPSAPKEIRTLVLTVKGLRPGPLDNGTRRSYGVNSFKPVRERTERSPVLKPVTNHPWRQYKSQRQEQQPNAQELAK